MTMRGRLRTTWLLLATCCSLGMAFRGLVGAPSRPKTASFLTLPLDDLVAPILPSSFFDMPETVRNTAIGVSVVAAALSVRPSGPLLDSQSIGFLLEGTYLQGKPVVCAYKGSRDGWSAVDFHNAVDGRGCGLVVAKGRNGAVFGGWNPSGWRSTDDYYTSSAAFLWCKSKGSIVKFPVLAGGNAAVFDYATAGPCFGTQDLQLGPPQAAIMGGFAGPDMEDIGANAGDLRKGKASIGFTYSSDTRWPARGNFALSDVEVYCNADL